MKLFFPPFRTFKLTLLFTMMGVLLIACGTSDIPVDSIESEITETIAEETQAADTPTAVQEENPSLETENEAVPVSDSSAGLAIDPDSVEIDAKGLTVGFTTDGHPFRGNPEAAVIIQEFSDYQCPFCSRFFVETLPSLEANQISNSEAVLVFFDFPLNSLHPQANSAALAARCAGEQGAVAYWQMHDSLFENPEAWSNENHQFIFIEYATDNDLDSDKFSECLNSGRHQDKIQADLALGSANGISGTPSFVINGQLLVGAQPTSVFDDAIATIGAGGQLASAQQPQAQNPPQPAAAPTPATINAFFAAEMGDPNAPVTIIEFTDYQCPYCSRHSIDTMPIILQDMIDTGRVHYILKDLPLDQLHPNARKAAAAARCAGEQDGYWEMHDIIFENQEAWAGLSGSELNEIFSDYGTNIGLDGDGLLTCLENGQFDAEIETNVQEARALGIGGTPFFFVDGYPLNGARPIEHFELAVSMAEEGRLAEAYLPAPEQQQQQPPPQPSGPQDVPIGNAFTIGDANAPITIIEYTDFQCPFCTRHFQQTYPQILSQYVDEGLVRYVFKDFPLTSIHPQAEIAAEAARCAGDQNAFLEMHDLLFDRQQEWSNNNAVEIMTNLAADLGMDGQTFNQCLTSGKHKAAVQADLQEGINLGITGTPSFFINGLPLVGAQPYTAFEQAFTNLLAQIEGQ